MAGGGGRLTRLLSNNVGVTIMGLVTITLFYFGYQQGLQPILRQRQRAESSEIADFIYKKEVEARSRNLD